jgi:hypothetical protein
LWGRLRKDERLYKVVGCSREKVVVEEREALAEMADAPGFYTQPA